jgi:isopenicillin-N epimerase
MNRRNFISNTTGLMGIAIGSTVLKWIPDKWKSELSSKLESFDDWNDVKSMFKLNKDFIFMSALLISTHPKQVREAIEHYRDLLDKENVPYFRKNNRKKQNLARENAAKYLGVEARNIALTDSTTTGIATIYNGLNLEKSDEIILGSNDYYSTYESIRLRVERSGAKMVEIPIYEKTSLANKETLTDMVIKSISKKTKVIALTWVHSGTGLKLPIQSITNSVKQINRQRPKNNQIMVVVDGVHGFGVEDFIISDLGCDFFIAGCHKWLFGPRGTGIIWGSDEAWKKVRPTIPSFLDSRAWNAWQQDEELPSTNAATMSPGGFKAFEHIWALSEAFEFHEKIGKKKIMDRCHQLSKQIKEGLSELRNIKLITPMESSLSSGIICFDVIGTDPWKVNNELKNKNIIASVTPYSTRHLRLTPSIYNSEQEIETVLSELKKIVG